MVTETIFWETDGLTQKWPIQNKKNFYIKRLRVFVLSILKLAPCFGPMWGSWLIIDKVQVMPVNDEK